LLTACYVPGILHNEIPKIAVIIIIALIIITDIHLALQICKTLAKCLM
jgi:hypothetical protein